MLLLATATRALPAACALCAGLNDNQIEFGANTWASQSGLPLIKSDGDVLSYEFSAGVCGYGLRVK